MDKCCAPQWADFTRSPCLPSDSYFEVEHEVHRSRRQAERLAAEFKTRFDNMPANFEIEVNTQPENISAPSSQVKLSFFVPLDSQDANKTEKKFIPHRMVQSLRLGDPGKRVKKRLSDEIASLRRRTNTFGRRKSSQVRGQAKVLTCQYVKKCPTVNRRHSNQFVSLAESVSKFQSEMPQRFRTLSNKNLKPMLPIKTKQKLTYPVSPALRCKYRTRTATKPVPPNVTNESMAAPKNVSKKPAPTIKETCLNIPKKTPPNELVPEVKPTNKGKTVPRLPATFEARNKDLQMKREQRVKALQEPTKVKTEFHAKPAPNFSKKPVSTTQEQPHKKAVAPRPFSFDQRDKCLAKKKEERIKQLQENDKKPHVFHANPVPSYKPVSVRSTSKENLRNKELEARKQAHESQPKPSQRKPASKPEPLRQITSVTLNRDNKPKERCVLDEKIRRKRDQEVTGKQESQRNRLNGDRQEQAEMRRVTETRARPMPVYKLPLILKSSKSLTNPKSPAWASRPKSMKPIPQ